MVPSVAPVRQRLQHHVPDTGFRPAEFQFPRSAGSARGHRSERPKRSHPTPAGGQPADARLATRCRPRKALGCPTPRLLTLTGPRITAGPPPEISVESHSAASGKSPYAVCPRGLAKWSQEGRHRLVVVLSELK